MSMDNSSTTSGGWENCGVVHEPCIANWLMANEVVKNKNSVSDETCGT
jgi:hypothetical protein